MEHKICPQCGSQKTSSAVDWQASSLEPQDRDNHARLVEHQCHNCGVSFWLGAECQVCKEEGRECAQCEVARRNQERRDTSAEKLLRECPDIPDDFRWSNKDAVEAFEEAFKLWKAKVRFKFPDHEPNNPLRH